jgi:hypothetical protein
MRALTRRPSSEPASLLGVRDREDLDERAPERDDQVRRPEAVVAAAGDDLATERAPDGLAAALQVRAGHDDVIDPPGTTLHLAELRVWRSDTPDTAVGWQPPLQRRVVCSRASRRVPPATGRPNRA